MLGSSTSVKLDKDLFGRIKRCADAAGYSSPQEFVQHVLEKELSKIEEGESDESILKKLQGLGYIE
jgi:metal-responsive CopG/Arc/MetJ family transcriptional regulator